MESAANGSTGQLGQSGCEDDSNTCQTCKKPMGGVGGASACNMTGGAVSYNIQILRVLELTDYREEGRLRANMRATLARKGLEELKEAKRCPTAKEIGARQ